LFYTQDNTGLYKIDTQLYTLLYQDLCIISACSKVYSCVEKLCTQWTENYSFEEKS